MFLTFFIRFYLFCTMVPLMWNRLESSGGARWRALFEKLSSFFLVAIEEAPEVGYGIKWDSHADQPSRLRPPLNRRRNNCQLLSNNSNLLWVLYLRECLSLDCLKLLELICIVQGKSLRPVSRVDLDFCC